MFRLGDRVVIDNFDTNDPSVTFVRVDTEMLERHKLCQSGIVIDIARNNSRYRIKLDKLPKNPNHHYWYSKEFLKPYELTIDISGV